MRFRIRQRASGRERKLGGGSIVNISARSMGAFNVQIVMEALGGGGHLTMAATQLKTDLNTAGRLLKDAIDDYIRNNG